MAWARRHPVAVVFLLAFAARALVAIGAALLFSGAVFGDDATYRGLAMDVLTGTSQSWDPYTRQLFEGTAVFMLPLTVVLGLTGGSVIAGQMLVGVMGALAAAATFAVARRMLRPAWALLAGGVVALLPSQVLWSSVVLKDAFVWAALAGLALAVARANQAGGAALARSLAACALLLGALAFLRPHTTVVAAWALALAVWFGMPQERLRRGLAALLVSVMVPWLSGFGPGGIDVVASAGSLENRRFFNALDAASAIIDPNDVIDRRRRELQAERRRAIAMAETARDRVEELARLRTERAHALASRPSEPKPGRAQHEELEEMDRRLVALIAEAERHEQRAEYTAQVLQKDEAYVVIAEPEGLSADVRHLPHGLSVMLLQPFPFTNRPGLHLRLAGAESALLWYPLLALALVGLATVRRRLADMAFPMFAGGGILLAYALTEGNVGTAYRHRGEFVWVVALLAALGAARLSEWRKAQG